MRERIEFFVNSLPQVLKPLASDFSKDKCRIVTLTFANENVALLDTLKKRGKFLQNANDDKAFNVM